MTQSSPRLPPGPVLYLSAVQFVFFTCWTVYVIFLPGLLETVGLPRSAAGWVLLVDQLLFAAFDVITGFAADRAFRLYGRVAPWVIGLTAVSALTFLLLPWLALEGERNGAGIVFLGLICLWAVTSSALRSPAFVLLTRHVTPPHVPLVAGLSLAGTGVAAALAPYLGLVLRGVDPRVPFALTSLALFSLTLGLVWAERAAGDAAQRKGEARRVGLPSLRPSTAFALIALAALASQVLFSLNAAPRYGREAGGELLPWLMPVFQVGFSLAVSTAWLSVRRLAPLQLFAGGCLVAAAGAWSFLLPGLAAALAGQFVAGLGWGAALAAAFGLASAYGRARRPSGEAAMTGLLFSMLALASAARIAMTLAGVPEEAIGVLLLALLPPLAWTAAAIGSAGVSPRMRPA